MKGLLQWSYTKTSYQRTVSASLDVDAKFASGPRRWSKALSSTVADYDVVGDPRHNVPGHGVNRDIVERPESLLPSLGLLIARELAEQVRAGINRAREERAVKAFEAAGHEAARIENRGVDATAFDVAGGRLQKPVQHGDATLTPGTAFTIPADIAPPSCLLVVATASDPEAQLTLSTADGTYGDLRGRSSTTIEMCPGEGASKPVVQLSTNKAAQARWGVYATDAGSPNSSGQR